MGYFKQQQIAEQEKVDRLVAFYRWHRATLPEYFMGWLLRDDERLWSAIAEWERLPYPPKPAISHVALQSGRRQLIEQRKRDKASRRSDMLIVGWFLICAALLVAGLIIYLEVS